MLTAVPAGEATSIDVMTVLVSVFDKAGLEMIAACLPGVRYLSTGGTLVELRRLGLDVLSITDYTGSPEMLDGRVKTLHPRIHAGLLSVRGNAAHEKELLSEGIHRIDLVIANLYPFEEAARDNDMSISIENIDIGGTCLIRSAAKNSHGVCVITSPRHYVELRDELRQHNGATTPAFRATMAARAFLLTASYDTAIAEYLNGQYSSPASSPSPLPRFDMVRELKYGCNPHQERAALCSVVGGDSLPFEVLSGSPGYINVLDAVNAWQLVKEMQEVTGVISAASFKHVSPAGAAIAHPLTEAEAASFEVDVGLSGASLAYVRARNADPLSSFGDMIALSGTVDLALATMLKSAFSDGIIAAGFTDEALALLKAKKGGRFLVLLADASFRLPELEYRSFGGVGLVQKRNDRRCAAEEFELVTDWDAPLTASETRDLLIAAVAVKYTQSNSVGFALGGMMIGIGAGQQSRVDCVKLASHKAETWWLRQHPKVLGLRFKQGVNSQARINARVKYIEGDMSEKEQRAWREQMAELPEELTLAEKRAFMSTLQSVCLCSDGFFPFPDSIEVAAKFGVSAILQPGGSVQDAQVLETCNDHEIKMAFSHVRLFHH